MGIAACWVNSGAEMEKGRNGAPALHCPDRGVIAVLVAHAYNRHPA